VPHRPGRAPAWARPHGPSPACPSPACPSRGPGTARHHRPTASPEPDPSTATRLAGRPWACAPRVRPAPGGGSGPPGRRAARRPTARPETPHFAPPRGPTPPHRGAYSRYLRESWYRRRNRTGSNVQRTSTNARSDSQVQRNLHQTPVVARFAAETPQVREFWSHEHMFRRRPRYGRVGIWGKTVVRRGAEWGKFLRSESGRARFLPLLPARLAPVNFPGLPPCRISSSSPSSSSRSTRRTA
jgi:hypothetical protein